MKTIIKIVSILLITLLVYKFRKSIKNVSKKCIEWLKEAK